MKKKLNIPICDVNNDNDYEKNVSATFELPSTYIKHAKKIGIEKDILIDYCMDDNDEVYYYLYYSDYCYLRFYYQCYNYQYFLS